jgi:hypothetical protein
MPKMNSSKFLSRMHFNLKNGKLKFNLKKDNLKKRHYKPDLIRFIVPNKIGLE